MVHEFGMVELFRYLATMHDENPTVVTVVSRSNWLDGSSAACMSTSEQCRVWWKLMLLSSKYSPPCR